MKKPRSLQFVLSAKKIISVNALYGAKLTYSGSRPIATMYKKSEAKQMEAYIREQVKALDIPKNHPWVTKDTKFRFTFTVIFKSGYFMRDLDNCCKNLIDGIFRALGYNDSHICEIHCYKTLCPDIPDEKICIEMAEYTGESRFDKVSDLPCPESIYLSSPHPTISTALKGRETQNPGEADCEIHILSERPGMEETLDLMEKAYDIAVGGFGCLLVGFIGAWDDKDVLLGKLQSLKSPGVIAKEIEDPAEILNYVKIKKKNGRKIQDNRE